MGLDVEKRDIIIGCGGENPPERRLKPELGGSTLKDSGATSVLDAPISDFAVVVARRNQIVLVWVEVQ